MICEYHVLHFEARDRRPANGFMNILRNCIFFLFFFFFCMYSVLDSDQNFKPTESMTYVTSHSCTSAILTITDGHIEREVDVNFVRQSRMKTLEVLKSVNAKTSKIHAMVA